MKVVVDIPARLWDRLFRVLQEGAHSSPSALIQAALENQLQLEEGSVGSVPSIEVFFERARKAGSSPASEIPPKQEPRPIVPPEFRRPSIEGVRTVARPEPPRAPMGSLWGQFNRIFATKLTIRCLTALTGLGDEWADLEALQEKASVLAREFGMALDAVDRREGNKRGEKLSTALPVSADDPLAALSRFRNQFVGYLTKDDRIQGMPGAMRYINIVRGSNGKERVGITDDGLHFASLENPLLDKGEMVAALSREEADACVQHVFEVLPDEARLMVELLRAIKEGIDTPDDLNRRLRQVFKEELGNVTGAVVNTTRSGCLSRMNELGLISKERRGTSVRYTVTAAGGELLARNTG